MENCTKYQTCKTVKHVKKKLILPVQKHQLIFNTK